MKAENTSHYLKNLISNIPRDEEYQSYLFTEKILIFFLDDLPPDYTEVELNPPEVGDKYQRFE